MSAGVRGVRFDVTEFMGDHLETTSGSVRGGSRLQKSTRSAVLRELKRICNRDTQD